MSSTEAVLSSLRTLQARPTSTSISCGKSWSGPQSWWRRGRRWASPTACSTPTTCPSWEVRTACISFFVLVSSVACLVRNCYKSLQCRLFRAATDKQCSDVTAVVRSPVQRPSTTGRTASWSALTPISRPTPRTWMVRPILQPMAHSLAHVLTPCCHVVSPLAVMYC